MKVLGLSFGRRMKCSEILVKQALMGAEQAREGVEVSFLRTIGLAIGHCTGCGACGAGMRAGKQIRCVLKDDYEVVEQAVLEADAIVVAAPVYVLGPVGQFKNFVDRFGPAHDYAALEAERDRRAREGLEPLDPRALKRRFVGYISVGGAHTQNWVSFGLPGMHLFGISSLMKPVGQIDAYNMGQTGSPLLDKALMEQAFVLGQNLAAALGNPLEEAPWCGEEGVCPVCHCNQITLGKTTAVECPICGITGTLVVEGESVRVEFSPEQQARARYTRAGLQEHYEEIRGMGAVAGPKIAENREFLEREQERFARYPRQTAGKGV